MKSSFARFVTTIALSLAAFTSIETAHAAMVCEEVYDCHEECTINRKGVLKCNDVCTVTTQCYDDGNGGGTGGGSQYCYTDQLSGEIVCLLE